MKHGMLTVCFLALLPFAIAAERRSHPTLVGGVVSYTTEQGTTKALRIGKTCSDLWVSPDESVIAFIAIDNAAFGTKSGSAPLITKSSIYVARRTEGFAPKRVDVARVVLEGEAWHVLRLPSVSQDGRTLYFFVPVSIKDWTLLSMDLPNGRPKTIENAISYCVIWGGEHSGDLLLEKFVYEPRDEGLVVFWRGRAGATNRLGVPNHTAFQDLAAQWSTARGGRCTAPSPR